MSTRKDYGPQGCAERSAKLLGLFALLLVLAGKGRKRDRTCRNA